MREYTFRTKISGRAYRFIMFLLGLFSLGITIGMGSMLYTVISQYVLFVRRLPSGPERNLACIVYHCNFWSDFVTPALLFVIFLVITFFVFKDAFTKKSFRHIQEFTVKD